MLGMVRAGLAHFGPSGRQLFIVGLSMKSGPEVSHLGKFINSAFDSQHFDTFQIILEY